MNKNKYSIMKSSVYFKLISLLGLALVCFSFVDILQKKLSDIPRIWNKEAFKNWELPNANPDYSIEPVCEEFYYSLPERIIYKMCPVYHPDYEPESYWEWLHKQDAQIVFDASRLKTEKDWIKASELLIN
jgi:hypothetical protein